MKALYLDCICGISGNMFLGACLHAGVPRQLLINQLAKLSLPDDYEILISDVNKGGIASTYVDVQLRHVHHHHRNLADIRNIINSSSLSDSVKFTSLKIFEALALAEAKVHNSSPDLVHFHEVGAVDSIVDIVGSAICLDFLDVRKVFVSKINVGSGFVNCAHGLFPVPAPATAELLKGFFTFHNGIDKELTTPTGAAIVKALASFSDCLPPNFSVQSISYGAGTLDLHIPNVLRLYFGDFISSVDDSSLLLLQANIDDMNPQFYGHIFDLLLDNGALDVWATPIFMKKNRPAHTLSVLVDQAHEAICSNIIFEQSTSIGLRVFSVDKRLEAVRRIALVDTSFGQVRCKVSAYNGKIVSVSPEYDDCKKLALLHDVPIKAVWLDAISKQQERLDF